MKPIFPIWFVESVHCYFYVQPDNLWYEHRHSYYSAIHIWCTDAIHADFKFPIWFAIFFCSYNCDLFDSNRMSHHNDAPSAILNIKDYHNMTYVSHQIGGWLKWEYRQQIDQTLTQKQKQNKTKKKRIEPTYLWPELVASVEHDLIFTFTTKKALQCHLRGHACIERPGEGWNHYLAIH